ncbi:MAG: hypothetical protein WD027_06790 [Gaiellales bacterium]
MKRLALLLILVVLAPVVPTACGGDEGDDAAGTTAPTEETMTETTTTGTDSAGADAEMERYLRTHLKRRLGSAFRHVTKVTVAGNRAWVETDLPNRSDARPRATGICLSALGVGQERGITHVDVLAEDGVILQQC